MSLYANAFALFYFTRKGINHSRLKQNYANHSNACMSKIHTIFEGTSEIQQLVIARAISGLRVE